MTAQELTAALVAVYARLRRGDLEPPPARREAAGYFETLRELARDRREKAHVRKDVETRVEVCFLPPEAERVELVRLTPDFRPWEEVERDRREGSITPEDVDLLEVNLSARARRGEVDERTASAEAYVLKALRLGLALAPVAGPVTWGELHATTGAGLMEVYTGGANDPNALVTAPVVTFVHGNGERGRDPEDPEPLPPWPIRRAGTVTGYYAPKGWRP